MKSIVKAAVPSLVLLLCGRPLLGAEPAAVKDLDNKIKSHKKDLEQIQQQIRSLEDERERLRRDEDTLGRTVKSLESEIERSTKAQVRQRRTVLETEDKMRRLKDQIELLSDEGKMWEKAIFSDLRTYHQQVVFPSRMASEPMEAWILRSALRLRIEQMRDTHSKMTLSQQKEKDLAQDKVNLLRAKSGLEIEIAKQKRAKEEKAKVYKTTQGKRLIAEHEAQRLNETRDALEGLINGLAEKRSQTLAEQREAELAKRSMSERRGNFPWPAEGSVVSHFGRQKHPDLDITVIQNGIKIKTAPRSWVKAVEKGTVIFASDFRSYGRTVILDHGGEIFSVYGLLGDITVREGEKVAGGRPVGTAEDSAAPQIYFELKNQGRSEDPLLWLKTR